MEDNRCPECQYDLMISDSGFESDVGSTDVFSVLKLVCINPKCSSFIGQNLNNPDKVVKVVRNKVN